MTLTFKNLYVLCGLFLYLTPYQIKSHSNRTIQGHVFKVFYSLYGGVRDPRQNVNDLGSLIIVEKK